MDNIRNRFSLDAMDLEFANEILEDNGYQGIKLTNKRKMILGTLLYINGIDEKDSNGYFFVENSYLCQLIGISEPALIESLKYFNSVGILSRISGKRGSASLYKIEKNFSKNFSNKIENFSNNLSKNFSKNLKNFSTDIEEDKDIDKEIELKKDIEKNNIYNILNNINNNILYIKEKNIKKEKEIEELNFKVSQLIERVDDKINNKDNFEINMKKENNKINTTPTQEALELIITKLISIETRITSIEEEIKSLKGQNCAVTEDNTSSNINTPIEEDNAAEAKEMASETIDCIPTEVIEKKIEEKSTKIEKRSIPTFVDCKVKVTNDTPKKVEESPRKAFRNDLTASNTSTGVIVPQGENKPAERKRISDEEWKQICERNERKRSTPTRDVMGSNVPCANSSEGWVEGKKQFNSEKEIYAEIEVWKQKGLDIMQISTRFVTNWNEYTMTDKLYSPSKVSNQIKEVEEKKEENNTPSESNEKVDKVAEILSKVNKDTEKEVVEKVHKNTEENVYYAETNTATFEYENDDFTTTEEALDNIFSSDYGNDEELAMNRLNEELAKRRQEAVVEAPF